MEYKVNRHHYVDLTVNCEIIFQPARKYNETEENMITLIYTLKYIIFFDRNCICSVSDVFV